ncbi:MAG: Spermidine/putrescine-binding periplasmic protein precursor [Pseudomonadota bacterium]
MSTKTPVQTLAEDLQQGRLSRRNFVLQALGLGVSLSVVGSVLTACSGGEGEGDAPPTPGADPAADADTLEKELRIYIWSDYLAEDTVPNFEKEFGVKATVDTYESNEELVAKLQSGVSGYDLVCPSGYAITVLSALGLIEKLDASRIPNLGNIAATFRKTSFDPNDDLTVPWQWGTTGVAYRKDLVPTPPDSWAIFHDKAQAGKMTMMDDMRDVIGAWLRFRGHSLNSKDPAQLAQAKADAVLAKANLQSFLSAPVKAQLISGDVRVAQLWNGDTAQATAENDQIAFVLPKERLDLARLHGDAQDRAEQEGRPRLPQLRPAPRGGRRDLQRHGLRHPEREGRAASGPPRAVPHAGGDGEAGVHPGPRRGCAGLGSALDGD